jgi:ATP-dependent Zn protease
MAYAEEKPAFRPKVNEHSLALAREWRKLGRAATFVAILTSPALFVVLYRQNNWSLPWAIIGTALSVVAFRGLVDVIAHRLIPSPSLYGAEDALAEEDIVARRRLWYWRKKFRRLAWLGAFALGFWILIHGIFGTTFGDIGAQISANASTLIVLAVQLPLLFLINFGILFGPLVFLGIQQIKGYEPGDADWGVRLKDVRGQAEAKEEITRVVSLWQSGEEFEKAGGKRERGVLFIGPPGTGKTMLSKGIATSFNCPFVTIPGSGFAQTFMGMDAVIVRFLARKAKKLASKWGGQCIVFIDEIDAVGMRRQSLGGGGAMGGTNAPAPMGPGTFHDHAFHGPLGALNPSGDLILETRAWRDKLFASRAPETTGSPFPPFVNRIGDSIRNVMFPGMMGGMGGGLALNQLLVVMDGIDDPPLSKRVFANRVNTFLDAIYIVPRRVNGHSLRVPKPKPRKEEIYFIGACNVPLEMLDPALTRPGRMGRHVWFRTPTKDDRVDIFDLYLAKVDHEPDLDTERRRDELARMTNGYSPAMIEQVTSMALTLAHSEGRPMFGRRDLVEAMTTVESGTAVGVEYVPEETRAVAIHEAGHAVASHAYMSDVLSTRLSIRMRGASLGHHQAIEKEERFSSWRSEEFGKLVWTLGAMAAEHVFYGENGIGVGGDIASATGRAAWMVGSCGMGAYTPDLTGRFAREEDEDAAREKIMRQYERIGSLIMARSSSGNMMTGDPLGSVLSDRDKRASAQALLGQAYVAAFALIEHNREKVEGLAEVLIERREMHGDEIVEALDKLNLVKPELDMIQPGSWPKL